MVTSMVLEEYCNLIVVKFRIAKCLKTVGKNFGFRGLIWIIPYLYFESYGEHPIKLYIGVNYRIQSVPCACINNCNGRQLAIKEKELLCSYVLKYQTKHLNYPALEHATAGSQPGGCKGYHGWFNGGQFGKVGLHWLLFIYVYKSKHRLASWVWYHWSMMILIDLEVCGLSLSL